MSSNIYITPRTSLVLIKSLAQETTIYMSTYRTPDFQINIRNATDSTNPIHISTINGARFTNNTSYYTINQPYGFVNLSLRTSTLWQILHTSGQTPSESAANIQQTNISTAYLGLVSTATKQVSTMFIENLETPNSIQLVGPFVIGNLSTPGFILFKSTLNVYGDATFEKPVFVSGATTFLSTLFAKELLPLSSVFRTYSSLTTDGSVFVKGLTQVVSTLETQSTLQVTSLDVQKSTIGFTTYLDTLTTVGISTLRNIQTSSLTVENRLTVGQTVSTLGGLFSTGSLTVDGNLLALSNVSTYGYAIFQSSVFAQSSVTSLHTFDVFSTANIAKLVSSTVFSTSFLSSSASFSSLGPLSVQSNIEINGTLSTNWISVLSTLSVGGTFVTQGSVSSFHTSRLSSLDGKGTLLVQTLSTQSIGVGGNVTLYGNSILGDFLHIESNVGVGSNLVVGRETHLSSVGVASNITVLGDMIVNGTTTIDTYNVASFGISSLQITTSSPSVALRASTLISPYLESLQGKFIFNLTSGTLSTVVNSSIQTNSFYTNTVESAIFSTQTLYTDSVVTDRSPITSQFEILQKAVFQRGLSTTFVNATTIEGAFEGRFIGDGSHLENTPLQFTNISASLVLVSSIQTQLFSTNILAFNDIHVSTNITTNTFDWQGTTGVLAVFSTGTYYSQSRLSTINGLGLPFYPNLIEELSPSILALNRLVYFDAGTSRVGIGISSPLYNLDISGLLSYTGTLSYDEIAPLHLSTTKNPFYFSSLTYRSAVIRDSFVLPENEQSLQLGTPINDKRLRILEGVLPVDMTAVTTAGPCIRANSNFSTIDVNFLLFAYNNTKNVGIGTAGLDVPTQTVFPAPIPSIYDLYSQTELVASDIIASSLNLLTGFEVQSFLAPTLGINPDMPSTLNTFSTANSSTIVLNNFVELIKDTTLKGSFHIKRPVDTPLRNLFTVYNEAYISSVSITNLTAETLCYAFQDL